MAIQEIFDRSWNSVSLVLVWSLICLSSLSEEPAALEDWAFLLLIKDY